MGLEALRRYLERPSNLGKEIPVRLLWEKKSWFSEKIMDCYSKYNVATAFIYGEQGAGKTTYALLILYGVYGGDWEEVLRHTFFYIEPLLSEVRGRIMRGERYKAVLLDDAGIWLEKYAYRERFHRWFSKFFNLIRTVSAGVLITSVEFTDILKSIRDKVKYRVHVVRRKDYSEARVYKMYTIPSLEKRVVKLRYERFKLDQIPEWVREKYEEKRREALLRLLDELEEPDSRQLKLQIDPLINELIKQVQTGGGHGDQIQVPWQARERHRQEGA